MNLILLGAPGAGKGTQAEMLMKHFGIQSISTGNCLREAVANQTELGKRAASTMNGGGLVPDEVVNEVVKERLAQKDCKNGFILDGFPRTIPQAEYLDALCIQIDKVLDLEVPDQDLIQRISGRRVCSKCGAPYHISNYSSEECKKCGGKLISRKDDTLEIIRERIQVYHNLTEPLKAYYAKAGKLCRIDGRGAVDKTADLIIAALEPNCALEAR